METRLTIGDFSRMTYLSIKALRHYHELGLLAPLDVDPHTGYRFYGVDQVPTAQVIRRFRALGMPVEQIRTIIDAPDLATRNDVIVEHLRRMESQLEQTQHTVASLRELLAPPPAAIAVEFRSVPPMLAVAIRERVELVAIERWFDEAFAELDAAVRADGRMPAGPRGGIFPTELFSEEVGDVTLFVPLTQPLEQRGRVRTVQIPSAELAITVHHGSLHGADRTYGALGTYVAERALGVEGPIRENYLVSAAEAADASELITEIGWPIFRTAGRTEPKRNETR
jgi:DNA-binding transcriptional MerR regulator